VARRVVVLRMKGCLLNASVKVRLIAPKDDCEVADKRMVRIELTTAEPTRPVKRPRSMEKIAIGTMPLGVNGKVAVEGKKNWQIGLTRI
jgi:hypothetical protein